MITSISSIFIYCFIALFLLYVIALVTYINAKIQSMKLNQEIDSNIRFSGAMESISTSKDRILNIKSLAVEDKMLKKLGIRPKDAIIFLWIVRVVVIVAVVAMLFFLRGLGLCFALAIISNFVFNDMYLKMIYNSGIDNIPKIVSFINFFVPQLNSGVSADQALTIYIQTNADVELADYYKNKDDSNYKIPLHLKQIVDIYDLAIYNENMGINDYTYILMEMSEDINEKSSYYNKFLGAMGAVKPIGYCFTLGIPTFILISYSQTGSFWQGTNGWLAGIAIAILYATYKFLMFKLQSKTVSKIF